MSHTQHLPWGPGQADVPMGAEGNRPGIKATCTGLERLSWRAGADGYGKSERVSTWVGEGGRV